MVNQKGSIIILKPVCRFGHLMLSDTYVGGFGEGLSLLPLGSKN